MLCATAQSMENVVAAGHHYGVKHLKAQASTTLTKTLQEQLNLSCSEIELLLNLGAVYLNEKRLPKKSHDFLLNPEDYLRVHTQPRRFPVRLLDEAFSTKKLIHFEHPDFYILSKPSGLPVHASVDNTEENLIAFLEKTLGEKLYITHRLDVPTSGLIFIARNLEAQKKFNQLLSEMNVTKIYKALVHGIYQGPRQLTHFMQPSPRAPKVVSSEKIAGWLTCQLEILDCEEQFGTHSLLSLKLETGRTHQIRAQLSSLGHPIVGDKSYGSPVTLDDPHVDKIALEAFFLSFPWDEKQLQFKVAE